MSKRGTGSFQITAWDEAPLGEDEDSPGMTQASVKQRYSGLIEGESRVAYLMMHRADETARFVGYEKIFGAVDGKRGSFTLEHRGSFEAGVAESAWTVVPGSATGELAGLTGEGVFRSGEHGRAEYEFTYALE